VTAIQLVAVLLPALTGTAVVLARDTVRQALTTSLFAFSLVGLFVVLQAPDVALSEIVVGAIGFPLILAVAVARSRG
jgi:energy-converting hydrogenase B subunit D